MRRMQSQTQLSSLQSQVEQLSELNKTLKTYLEEIVSRVAPKESRSLIRTETKRLEDARVRHVVLSNPLARFLFTSFAIAPEDIQSAALSSDSLDDFLKRLTANTADERLRERAERLKQSARAQEDFGTLKQIGSVDQAGDAVPGSPAKKTSRGEKKKRSTPTSKRTTKRK